MTTNIQQIAQTVIQVELETLQELKDSINLTFERTVHLIYNASLASGRLVVTGIGKSALIGQKIVATLNSTGTPSIFMHAADAIHGDLGMIRPEDVVLCISKSGETGEVKALIPLVKNLGNTIVGMTSKATSTLGKQSDYLLYTPVKREADPNNLAPTASTTAQAAMGDALAMTLLALRGFSAKDFAKFHPGGSLGKQLYLRVSDIYPKNDCPRVLPSASIQEVILEISTKRLGATAIIGENDNLLGIITDGDLRRMLSQRQELANIVAQDVMSARPKTIAADTLAIKALHEMREFNISQLIVLQEDKYVGMIHLHDLIKEGLV